MLIRESRVRLRDSLGRGPIRESHDCVEARELRVGISQTVSGQATFYGPHRQFCLSRIIDPRARLSRFGGGSLVN